MNLVAQLWGYLTKVYDLPRRLRAIQDIRSYPEISTERVSAALFLGAVLRLPSFRQMAKDSARAGWRRLLKLPAPLSDDVMAYVVERYRLKDWREVLVSTNKTLKRNRALE